MEFFGISLTRIDDADSYLRGLFASSTRRIITTPNPEILLRAREDAEFRRWLMDAGDRLPDGIGLYAGAMIAERRFPWWIEAMLLPFTGIMLLLRRKALERKYGARIPGSTLTTHLLEYAGQKELTVAILDRDARDWAEKSAIQSRMVSILKDKFPGIRIHLEIVDDTPDWAGIAERIRESGATILLSALGMCTQERAIYELLPQTPDVRIAAGIGSSIDYHVGLQRRAPAWVGHLGFEWLYRLAF